MSAPSPRPDVLVLGAGAIGLACALRLLRAGRSVTVLDAGRVGGGASHGNCGTITPSHANPLAAPGVVGMALRWMLRPDAPFWIKPRWDPALWAWLARFAGRANAATWARTGRDKAALLLASRAMLAHWVEDEGLDCEFEASGLHYAWRDARAFAAAPPLAAALRGWGIDAQLLDGPALAAAEPALRPEGLAGGLYFPGDARLRPDRFVAALAARVRALGGVIEAGVEASALLREGGRAVGVATPHGPRHGREVLLALGAWSPRLARTLGLRLPVQPGKGYSITWGPHAGAPRVPLVLKEASVCVTGWASGFRLGSTMEFSGYDTRLDPVRLGALERGAAAYLRALPPADAPREPWYGWRPMTVDDLPLLGPAPGVPGLWLATGHGMMGITMAAATGEVLAAQIARRAPPIDARPYLAARMVRPA
jgi:D-amino-acid dehydrogenase